MNPNPDLLDLMIADRQRAIREAMSEAKQHNGFATARGITGRALIALGERIRGNERTLEPVMLAPSHDARLTALHSGSR